MTLLSLVTIGLYIGPVLRAGVYMLAKG